MEILDPKEYFELQSSFSKPVSIYSISRNQSNADYHKALSHDI